MMHLPQIYRAELITLLAGAKNDERSDVFAALLGFECHNEVAGRADVTLPALGVDIQCYSPPPAKQESAELRFWRVESASFSDVEKINREPSWYTSAKVISKEELLRRHRAAEGMKTEPPLLLPWARLWPFLRHQVGVVSNTGAIDMARCVSLVARQKPLHRLPRRRVRHWPPEVHCLLDHSPGLRPFYNDMEMVVKSFTAMCGKHRVKTFLFPFGITQKAFIDQTDTLISYKSPARPISLLAFTDLGFYRGEEASLDAWRALGATAQQQHSRMTALIPCMPGMWRASVTSFWPCMYWERGQRAETYRLANIAAGEGAGKETLPVAESARGARLIQFLSLISPLIRREPELVRHIRYLLPRQDTDVSMEVELFSSRDDLRTLRPLFIKQPLARRRAIAHLLRGYHGHLPEILAMEYAVLKAIDPEMIPVVDMAEIGWFQEDLVKTLNDRSWRFSGFSEGEILGWFYRMEHQLPDEAYKDPRIAAAWVMAHKTAEGGLDTENIPSHLVLEEVAWALFEKVLQEYKLYRNGSDLVAVPTKMQAGENINLGVTISVAATAVVAITDAAGKKVKRRWDVRTPLPGLFEREEILKQIAIESASGSRLMTPVSLPKWAKAIGHDDSGLSVTLGDGRLLFWFPPGRYPVKLKGRDVVIEIDKGFWWDEDGRAAWQKNPFGNLDWANTAGVDEYGVYADFSVGKVRQRLRWIWPGAFLMGSPESEPERDDNEKQHEVIISKGFWLADTACTQELWQEVVGGDPSEFKGENLPVEMVGWEDCQRFIHALNERKPGLDLRLPSEAEWEFACRAGTVTPFSFGENITTAQVNYHGEYPYANGEKGERRGKAVAVKSFPGNGWGLFEMHGNVWEWCNDWLGKYPAETMIDPVGPDIGWRVIRGGSWWDQARFCRCAYRSRSGPVILLDHLGFRLAAGQKKQETGSGPEGWTAEARSDRRSTPNKGRGGDGGNWLSKIRKRIFK